MTSHTIRLHRVLRAPPERAYRAFLDPDAMAKWLPPHGGGVLHRRCDPRDASRPNRTSIRATIWNALSRP